MAVVTSAGQQPDPFVTVLDSLSAVAESVGKLDNPITDAQKIVSVVDNVLHDLDGVPTLLSGINDLLVALDGILAVLDAVPIVDAVASVCTEVVTSAQELVADAKAALAKVDESIVRPCIDAFDDLNKGLADTSDVVQTISTTVPNYINTLEILHFMAEIAEPLTEILQGSEAADDLSALLKTLNEVEEKVGEELLPLSDFLDGMNKVVQAISQDLESVFENMESTMEMVEGDLRQVDATFAPIVNAFNQVANAIAPIRWALDAFSWIFNTVCEPVINGILEATGLKDLVSSLQSTVEAKLGITPIINLVSANMNSQGVGDWQKQGGVQAASSGQSAWNAVSGTLEAYNTRNNDQLKKDVYLLISAVARTPIDPGKPAVMPDWPNQPNPKVPDNSTGTQPATVSVSMLAIPRQNPPSQALAGDGELQMLAVNISQAPAAPGLDVASLLAQTATTGGVPSLDQLRSLATQAHNDLAAAATLGPNLVADLNKYDAARTLPGDFQLSMQNLCDLFNDSVAILGFLEQFGFLTGLIEDLKTPLASQVSAIDSIVESCASLAQSGTIMDGVVNQVIAAVPSASVFTAALNYMDGIALAAASLSLAMAEAQKLDAKLNNTHKADLDDLQNQLEASAKAVTDQTNQVAKLADQCLTAGKILLTTMEDYATALNKLKNDSNVISSEALPNITKGVNILNSLTSILDPLSNLMQKLDCQGGNGVKSTAAAVITTFNASASTIINGQDQILRTLFNVVLSNVIHSDTLSSDIEAISALVQRDQSAFDQAQKGLTTALTALPDAMKATQQFLSTDQNGKTTAVDNFFINQTFATKAQVVFDAVQQAAKDAGLLAN